MAAPIIALTTDFGTGSSYVAQLKGVILSSLPAARIVDVSHDVPPQSVRHAEILLRGTAFAFPLGTVHLVVVDPGVGTARRPIAVASRGMVFVGPDNGLFGGPLSQPGAVCVELDRSVFFRVPVAATFHGRDIFAPVACELAGGLGLDDVGTQVSDPVTSCLPVATRAGNEIHGETLAADAFGNLLTNIGRGQVQEGSAVTVGARALRWVRTYGDAAVGELVALVGSDGFLELAVRDGSARDVLGSEGGVPVRCTAKKAAA